MSSTDEEYIPPQDESSEPLPSVEITVGNVFSGYHTRGATAEELGLVLVDGKWVSNE